MIYRNLIPSDLVLPNICDDDYSENAQSDMDYAVLGLNIFTETNSEADFAGQSVAYCTALEPGFQNLPISVIAQSPTSNALCELLQHSNPDIIETKNIEGVNYTVLSDSYGKWLFVTGIMSDSNIEVIKEQSVEAFRKMVLILDEEKFSMDNVVRQWNYIPNILQTQTDDLGLKQNYQIFNDVREFFYSTYKQNSIYPAATGIGVSHGNVKIDFLALMPENDIICVSMANPRQADAFKYSQDILIGSAKLKKPPLFARAKFVGNAAAGQVFVSGTASIIGEKTVGIDDIIEQTRTTIENIRQLISLDNIFNSTGFMFRNSSCKYARVYVKRREDVAVVTEICKTEFPEAVVLYVVADICRDNLLVEIECDVNLS